MFTTKTGIWGMGRGRTGSAADVVEGELRDAGVELEEEREGLANAARGTEDGDLGELPTMMQG